MQVLSYRRFSCSATPTLEQDHIDVKFALSFATANVLSVSSKPHGHAGKVQYLRANCQSWAELCWIPRESRGQEGASLVEHAFRLCAGGKGGYHGVELWRNLKQLYCYVRRKPQLFRKNDFVVLHSDPQRLLVKVDAKWISRWILVMHAPDSGTPIQERKEWWATTTSLLAETRIPHEQLIVCADANASPGASDGYHVFQEGLASTSSTPFLCDFLETFELCLPSTSRVHEGPRETWAQPNGLCSHQIDFVMVPAQHATSCTFSNLLETFDMANQAEDHTATAVGPQPL